MREIDKSAIKAQNDKTFLEEFIYQTENLHLPRKIIERHRKYIIAGIEIISGNYPILSEYLKFVREELEG